MAAARKKEKETELFSKLNAIEEAEIKVWLVSIKGVTSGTVKNPITKKSIITNTIDMGLVYPMIIKWCLTNLKGYDFDGIPNIKEIATSLGITISSNSPRAARGNTQPPPPPPPTSRLPITTILENWKKNPEIHPETGEPLDISINHESQYAKLYKEYIKMLVDDVLAKKQGSSSPNKDMLSLKDCKYIKECMPIAHTEAKIKDRANNVIDTIYYDHLFIKYFVRLQDTSRAAKTAKAAQANSYVYNYDVYYRNEVDIYLYLIVYDTYVRNAPKANDKDSKVVYNSFNTTVSLITSKYCFIDDNNKIGRFVNDLCIDIKNILYMHESRINVENNNAANYNREVLKYMLTLSHIKYINTQNTRFLLYNDSLRDELHRYVQTTYPKDVDRYVDRLYPENNLYNIYSTITKHTYDDPNCVIPKTLLAIYDSIIKLYSDNNMKNNVYKKVEDEYQTPTVVEPPFPIQEQLSPSSQRDRMRFKLMPNSIDDSEKRKRLQEDADRWKEKMDKYGKEKAKAMIELNQKKFDRNRINDIKNGKVSSHPRRKKWDSEKLHISKRPYNSASPPRVTIIKLINKLKAKSATANHISSSSGSGIVKPDGYYRNEADPYTQENFKDMLFYKRKHTSDIVHINNGKKFHWRYDTVSLYNYIIDCVRDCTKPVNIAVGRNALLTPENLDEVCRKIKRFTKQPTYASSNEIIAALANCKYDNCLELTYVSNKDHTRIRSMNNTYNYGIVGNYHIYLNLKLGGILFKVINKIADDLSLYDDFPNQTDPRNSIIMTLPILHDGAATICRGSNDDYTDGDMMLFYLKDRLAKGELLGDKYFPNRKNNDVGRRWKKVVDIPDFAEKFGFDIDENFVITSQNMIDYKAMLALL